MYSKKHNSGLNSFSYDPFSTYKFLKKKQNLAQNFKAVQDILNKLGKHIAREHTLMFSNVRNTFNKNRVIRMRMSLGRWMGILASNW